MDRQDSVGSGATSRSPSPISSTNTSPEPTPPSTPKGSFRGRTTSESGPALSVGPKDADEVQGQVAAELNERKTTMNRVSSWLRGLKGRRGSDPEMRSELLFEISEPQGPSSADAAGLMKTEELKKSREKNRKRLEKEVDLSSPSSIATNAFTIVTGTPPHKLSPLEKEVLQDEFRSMLEEHVNEKAPNYAELSKSMVQVVRKHSPVRQLTPNMSDYFDGLNRKVFSSSQMRSVQVELSCDSFVKMMGGAADEIIKQLRTPLFDRLFEGTTGVEQEDAYREIEGEIESHQKMLTQLEEQINRHDNDHPLFTRMLGDIQVMRTKLESQRSLLSTLRLQDFRGQQNYQSAAVISLEAFIDLLRTEKQAGNIKEPVTEEAARLSAKLECIRVLSSDQLRPNIVGDLINLEKELEALAHKFGISKVFKKAMVKARSERGWEPIVRMVPVRHGLETRLYRNTMMPMGMLLGYPGGVPSTGQGVIDKPCNGWLVEERSPEGRLTSRYVRSAVPDPYKAEGGDRVVGGHRRAELEYVTGLLSEYGGNADLLERRFGTEAKAFTPRIVLESYLTTDQFRNRTHLSDNEVEMNARAYDNFATIADESEDGEKYERIEFTDNQGIKRVTFVKSRPGEAGVSVPEPHRLEFTDAQGRPRAIYINKPKVALISCGSNFLALNLFVQVFTRSWNTADSFTQDAITQTLGKPEVGAELEGWVGEYLEDYQRRYGRAHPQLPRIQQLADEWRATVQLKEHHTAKVDTFKLINPSDAIWELIRDPNTLMEGQVPAEDAMVPVVRIRFCKSGKDRTGAGCASADRYRRELDTTGRVSVGEGKVTEDRMFNSQSGAITSQLEAQLANGYMGYKTNGEAKRLGEKVDKARRFKDRELD